MMDAQRQIDFLNWYLRCRPHVSLKTAMHDLTKKLVADALIPQQAPDIGKAIDSMRKIAAQNKLKIMAIRGTE
jgi:hypothetical protein